MVPRAIVMEIIQCSSGVNFTAQGFVSRDQSVCAEGDMDFKGGPIV
jgi:hypothetical protein